MKKIPVLLFLLLTATLFSQQYEPGETYYGVDSFIIYKAGNLPIILSAPHGGYLTPDTIPDRSCSGCVLSRSSYTQEISSEVYDAIHARTGCYPHVIINNLHRKKLDANREIVEATGGNPQTEPAWYQFHDFITAASATVNTDYGRGIYLDIQGNTSSIQRLQLGHILSGSELRNNDLNTMAMIDSSSIKLLISDNVNQLAHEALIRGASALGSLTDAKGFPAVPSLSDPFPLSGQSYSSGGYNTRRYCSKDGGTIDGIQVSCNRDVRFGTANVPRQTFADSLGSAVLEFVEQHYFPNLTENSCEEVVSGIDSSQIVILENITPGETYYGVDSFITYRAGNLPIILAASHGGYLEPDTIPDRNCSGCSYARDSYTQELSNEVYDAIVAKTGCYPHLVINRLHRRKLDANREIVEATDANPQTAPAWYDFHSFMTTATHHANADYGRGLYLDLHGHAHSVQRLELGYLLSGSELRNNDLNTGAMIDSSSIQLLVADNIGQFMHEDLIRGPLAFGSLIDAKGFPAVPSLNDPFPMLGESYFSGGYNTRVYSSRYGGTIDGLQIECNQDVRFNAAVRQALADSLATTALEYMELHYFAGFSQSYCGEAVQVIADSCGIKVLENCTNPLVVRVDEPDYVVEILDGNGVLYKSYPSVKHYYIDQQSLPAGTYFLKVKTEPETNMVICIDLD